MPDGVSKTRGAGGGLAKAGGRRAEGFISVSTSGLPLGWSVARLVEQERGVHAECAVFCWSTSGIASCSWNILGFSYLNVGVCFQ